MYKQKDSTGFNRYIGASEAIVIDNRDPANRGRIRVKHSLLGDTSWIEYVNDFGSYNIPKVGSVVYVQCDTGLYEYPFAWGNSQIGPINAPSIPTQFRRTVPTNRGFFSPGGHSIELDDGLAVENGDPKDNNITTNGRAIRITSTSGHTITINDDPSNSIETIVIRDKSGNGMVFDAVNNTVAIVSRGAFSTTAADNITISTDKGMTVNVPNDQETHTVKTFNVTAQDQVQIQGGNTALFEGVSETMVGGASGITKLAGGGVGVARIGDRAVGVGNLGGPVTSTIIQGSMKVFSG